VLIIGAFSAAWSALCPMEPSLGDDKLMIGTSINGVPHFLLAFSSIPKKVTPFCDDDTHQYSVV